jgi:hypothetical protein
MGHNGGPPLDAETVAVDTGKALIGLVEAPVVALGAAFNLVLGVGPAGSSAEDQAIRIGNMINGLGQAGSRPDIRVVQGELSDAQALFDSLTIGGIQATGSTYKGVLINMPDGGWIGLRTQMTNSPNSVATIDVNVPYVTVKKIKFNP